MRWYIDPGKHKSAAACFVATKLEHVWWVASFGPEPAWPHAVVIERPEVYPGPQPTRSNDVVELAMKAAELGGQLQALGAPTPRYVRPREWKGQVPKPIHHRRVWSVLDARERAVLCQIARYTAGEVELRIETACRRYAETGKVRGYSWQAHNLLDAVGLGLWDLGRMGRGVRN